MRIVGLPIEVLIEYFKLVQQGDQTIEARKEFLNEKRRQLGRKWKKYKKHWILDYTISVYEEVVLKQESELIQIEDY